MGKYVLYGHDGSANHGCEAIVRSTADLLDYKKNRIILVSANPKEDKDYHLDSLCAVKMRGEKADKLKKDLDFFRAYYALRFKKDYIPMDALAEKRVIGVNRGDIALSIGGDSYCYSDSMRNMLIYQHRAFKAMGLKTVLWGCSFEESLLENDNISSDIRAFDLITAREQFSYEALKRVNPNTVLVADSAFLLEQIRLPMPDGFEGADIVGINTSPLIERRESDPGMVRKCLENLIKTILSETNFKILLIPHVVWKTNDDRTVLQQLKDMFAGCDRISLLEDCNCMELKGYISRCRFFIGTRTHATIAAYSTEVPTLTIGYSIKSKGMAKDLFGTYKNYVFPVQDLHNENDLIPVWHWLQENESSIRFRLHNVLPELIQRIYAGQQALRDL